MPTQQEIQFAQYAIRCNMLTKEQAEECLRFQQAAEAAGQKMGLGQILIQRGVLTAEQIRQVQQWYVQAWQQAQAAAAQQAQAAAQPQQTPAADQQPAAQQDYAQASPYQAQDAGAGSPAARQYQAAQPSPTAADAQAAVAQQAEAPAAPAQPGQATPAIAQRPGAAQQAQPGATTRTVKLPGYEIIEKIGQGGMGSVFKARQVSMNRIVALKILPPRLAKIDRFVKRFVREAQSAGKLDHPNIVRGVDVGQAEGLYYFAMEFVEGKTANKIIKERGRLPENEAVDIVLQVARGLEHAYQQQIVHRDIKPDNIMVTNDGVAKLTDLGLAKSTTGETDITLAGATFATPDYGSPEQARGGDEKIDTISDIYSLGATLYHMLTGSVPFPGESATVVMTKHINEKLRSPKELVPELSDHVCHVVHKMMAKRREDRYQNPTELIADLEQVKAGAAPSKAAELAATSRAKEFSAARRAKAASQRYFVVGVIAAAVLLVVGVSVVIYRLRGGTKTVYKEKTITKVVGNVTPSGPSEAQVAFDKAKAYYQENPTDYPKCVEYFEAAKKAEGGAELLVDADKLINEVLKAREDAAKTAVEPLLKRAGELADERKWQEAMDELSKLEAVYAAVGPLQDTAAAGEAGVAKAKYAAAAQELFNTKKKAADDLAAQGQADPTKFDEAAKVIEEAKVCGVPAILESVDKAAEDYRNRKQETLNKAAARITDEWTKEISPKLTQAIDDENWEQALVIYRAYIDNPDYASIREDLKEQAEEVVPYLTFRDKVDEVISKCVGQEDKTIPTRTGGKQVVVKFEKGVIKLRDTTTQRETEEKTLSEEFINDSEERPRLGQVLRKYLVEDYGKDDPKSHLAVAAYEYFLHKTKSSEGAQERAKQLAAAVKQAEGLAGDDEALKGQIAWYKAKSEELASVGNAEAAEKLWKAISDANEKRNYTGKGGVLELIKKMEKNYAKTDLREQLRPQLEEMKKRASASSDMRISDVFHAAKFEPDKRDRAYVMVSYDFTDQKQISDFLGGWQYYLQPANKPVSLYVCGTGVFTKVPYTGDVLCWVTGTAKTEMHISVCAVNSEDKDEKSGNLRFPGYYIVLKKDVAQIFKEAQGKDLKDLKPVAERKTTAFTPGAPVTIKIDYSETQTESKKGKLVVTLDRPRKADLVAYEDKEPFQDPLAGRIGLYGRPGNFGAGDACTYTNLTIRGRPATAWIDTELARLASDKSDLNLAFNKDDAKKGGLLAYYYAGVNFDALKMTRLDPSINFDWALNSPDPLIPKDQFSVKWRGFINVPQNGTVLKVSQDDGIKIFIDGKCIYDRWADVRPATSFFPAGELTKGPRAIEVWFFDALMHASVKVYWQKPGTKLDLPIPADNLYYSEKLAKQYDAKFPAK
jgi:serine/threonine-protein kinase